MFFRAIGKLPAGEHLRRIKSSSNYKNGAFQNLSPTSMKREDISYWNMAKEFFRKHQDTKPPGKLPFIKTSLKNFSSTDPVLVWFGHSSYFIGVADKNFLVDPVFSGNASPLSFMVKAFPGSNNYTAGDMPEIDYLILTHDHYDHLDYKTICKLRNKVKKIYCSLGVGSHLKYWGVAETKITELDWWQSVQVDDEVLLTAAPARHFSGRGIKRGQTFWTSFILKTANHNFFLGGDSGYDTHFKEIGNKYGPFDLAILESGQYNNMWPLIHMMPEETVQAALDLKAKVLLPVHWAKFRLGMHPWNEPIKRVLAEAAELQMKVATPMIGELLRITDPISTKAWWELA